jgi:hypothetical protein
MGKHKQEDHGSGPLQHKYLKNNQHQKGSSGVAQVVEHLPRKSEALSSTSRTAKKIFLKKIKISLDSYIGRPCLKKNFFNNKA